MKKNFFLFAMLGATYTASPAVKFRVSWSSIPTVAGQIHNAKIWVWVDFLKINAKSIAFDFFKKQVIIAFDFLY
jgi:hypothetical protein